MQEITYCQSCGMPLENQEMLGTDAGGSKNQEYCFYCYQDGNFTSERTMEEMIALSVQHLKEDRVLKAQNKTETEAREFMLGLFPQLKRWQ
ncbi:zinc ribbon domain-containing protein [Enterococcus sp. ALS3]|uniref:Zinc ribbon domain-containing protein n=1 Tax=Enterococcus alishanensis TaxID=1303817 RepID=A0ABS6TBY6_9ENTE|nr:zinc ribbon domain-containing protein [Enterococcus alishanensis]MBV7390418.1 zinc ribbon domain-containing protein [Enterococcus alishanensis]